MKKQEGWKSRGMTLLEVTLVTILLGTVSLAFGYLYANSQRYVNWITDATLAQREAHAALEHIKRTLLQAVDIATPQVGRTDNRLNFSIQRSYRAQGVNASYALANGVLRYTEDGSSLNVASSVTNFSVTRSSPNLLVVTVTTEKVGEQEPLKKPLTTTIRLRQVSR